MASDVFAVSSQAEGFGTVFLKAWSSGKPVIPTLNVSAIGSLIKQRGGGLVSNGDSSDLGQAQATLLLERNARVQMGRAEREMASDFSLRNVAERTCIQQKIGMLRLIGQSASNVRSRACDSQF